MTTSESEKRRKAEERIALMLRKAESAGPEEAEALTEAAAKFMLKYGIEEAAINAARLGQDRTAEQIVTKSIDYTGVYSVGYITMAHLVTNALGELRGFTRNGRGSDKSWCIVGYERDVDLAITLLSSLALQAVVAVNAHIKSDHMWDCYSASQKYNIKRSFLMGFGRGASTRIHSAKRVVVEEATVTAPGTEVMLLNRATAVDAHVEKMFPDLKKSRGVKVVDSGFGAGRTAGLNANTGGKTLSGKKVIGS